MGSLLSVNLADVRTVERNGRQERTGIWKLPAQGRVMARRLGLEGDVQADPSVHGGVDKAVYAYAREDTDFWQDVLGDDLDAGTFGENLTVRGLDLTEAPIGQRWRVGGALLEVSEPRLPCWKLSVKMGDPHFIRRFAKALRPGAYLRVLEEGELGAGDGVEIVEQPDHDVTIRLLARAVLEDQSLAPRLLAAPALSAEYRAWAKGRAR
jgi:MOSC domain-containing protein YiiM